MIKKYIDTTRKLALAATALLLASCAHDGDHFEGPQQQAAEAVAFDASLERMGDGETSRSTYPTGGAGAMSRTNDKLKETAFGVFAQETAGSEFSYDGTGGTGAFNFMWNQQVEWDGTNSRWTYAPVKYWPNGTDEANAAGSPSNTATELQRQYLSFYAYAPYQEEATPATGFDKTAEDADSDGTPDADGIVKITANTALAGTASYLTYRTSHAEPYSATESVDLLWSAQPNLWKMKNSGEGYVDGRVKFLFKHALSKFTIAVQGLFDHRDNDDTSIEYSDDRDMYTRILVESVDFSTSPLFTEGKMYFAPRPDDAAVPYWEATAGKKANITVDGLHINPVLANTYYEVGGSGIEIKKYWNDASKTASYLQLSDLNGDDQTDAADALLLFNGLPLGVSHTEVSLYAEDDFFYMVIPNKKYITDNPSEPMKVRMVYYVITYDERLELTKTDYPKYFSIVKNDITATFSTSFAFEPNKQYKLLLQPGVTTVKFTVTSVDGWDTPITLNPEGVDWYTKPIEFTVE